MPTNPEFNLYNSSNEQDLWESLIIEAIQIYGIDVRYIPRQIENLDELYGEDQLSTFSTNYDIEIYVKSVDGFEGDGQFFSKFMGEIRDQITLTMSVRRFGQIVGTERPLEGDLIYLPLSGGIFQIKFVETRPVFYQIGTLQTYDLICELFEYSGERFNTGIAAVDILQTNYSTDVVAQPSLDLDVKPADFFSDNEVIEVESDATLNFDENNPFGEPE